MNAINTLKSYLSIEIKCPYKFHRNSSAVFVDVLCRRMGITSRSAFIWVSSCKRHMQTEDLMQRLAPWGRQSIRQRQRNTREWGLRTLTSGNDTACNGLWTLNSLEWSTGGQHPSLHSCQVHIPAVYCFVVNWSCLSRVKPCWKRKIRWGRYPLVDRTAQGVNSRLGANYKLSTRNANERMSHYSKCKWQFDYPSNAVIFREQW